MGFTGTSCRLRVGFYGLGFTGITVVVLRLSQLLFYGYHRLGTSWVLRVSRLLFYGYEYAYTYVHMFNSLIIITASIIIGSIVDIVVMIIIMFIIII